MYTNDLKFEKTYSETESKMILIPQQYIYETPEG